MGIHTGATWQIQLNNPCTVEMQVVAIIAVVTSFN